MIKHQQKWITAVLERMLNVNFIFSHIIVPLAVLSLYTFLTTRLLPVGVTKAFFERFEKYFIPTTILALVIFLGFLASRKVKLNLTETAQEKPSFRDWVFILLPLAPVTQYILVNNEILSGFESILLFCLFGLIASIPILVIPFFLRKFGSVYSLIAMGLSLAFFIANMPSLSKQFSWHEVGRFKIQLAFFCGVCFISWLMFQLKGATLARLFTVFLFVTNSVLQFFTLGDAQSAANEDITEHSLVTMVGSRKPVITPNIYLLVYDAYVSNETMNGYGIDNQPQEEYLADLGFKLYPQTYSLGASTLLTMSRVFNASPSFYSNNKWRGVSGDGVVQNLFEEVGYETYGVFPTDFFFRGHPSGYDYSYPSQASSMDLLIEAIFAGEFRFDLDFDEITQEEYLQEKEKVFSEVGDKPKFIYAHSSYPAHAQTSGVCLSNEVELFTRRLAIANDIMRQDVAFVLKNDPNAIVIVAGDHGPHLTKNCSITGDAYDISEISRLDIQDRFGTFLAIRWPSSDFEEYDDITVMQDLFQAIFAYLYSDTTMLDAKVEPVISDTDWLSGVTVINGVIEGGMDDGEPLFTETDQP